MADPRDTRAFASALSTVLASLADYASCLGIERKRFVELVDRAARGRLGSAEPDLPYEAAVRIVSRWAQQKPYCLRRIPKRLPMKGRVSFTSLVRDSRAGSVDLARRTLVEVGMVEEDSQGRLRLNENAYVPRESKEAKIEILGRAVADFVQVLTHNLSSRTDETFLQRVASYDNIPFSSLMMLRKALRGEGLRALERANALLASKDRDRGGRGQGGRRARVSFGVYMLEEPVHARRRKR